MEIEWWRGREGGWVRGAEVDAAPRGRLAGQGAHEDPEAVALRVVAKRVGQPGPLPRQQRVPKQRVRLGQRRQLPGSTR
jgi:hypothetical protein